MMEKIDLEKRNFRNFRSPVTLTLTLDRVTLHTCGVHQSLTSIYIPNFIEIAETFCGQMYERTDIPTNGHFPPLMLLGRLRGVNVIDLKREYLGITRASYFIGWMPNQQYTKGSHSTDTALHCTMMLMNFNEINTLQVPAYQWPKPSHRVDTDGN